SEPYARGVGVDGAIVRPPGTTPEDVAMLELDDGKTISFMSLVPLYPEEMDLRRWPPGGAWLYPVYAG
ncbi:suppressor of fused domain protein, partial [Mycobacterium tuberculosis]|nr:suppressor of fused domain protein [Mycobacterium tuberculosis]